MNKFSIDSNVKSTNRVNFPAGIQKGYLKSVAVKTVGKDDKEQEALVFSFVSTLKANETCYEFEHTEYQLDETHDKFNANFDNFKSKIKHIYEAFAPFPAEGINVTGENPTFLDFLKAIADSFNKNVGTETEPKTMFAGKPVNLKLIYNNKDYLSFPYAPNFIENGAVKVSMLQINPKYDKIVVTPKANPFAPAGGAYPDMNGGQDLPF